MDILRSFLLIGGLVVGLAALPCAKAQDAADSEDNSSGNASGSASGTVSATDLFPGGGAPSSNGARRGNSTGGHHNGGGHQHNGRRHDLLVSQADMDPLAVRVAFRRAKTVALARDPRLANLLHEADTADTDVDRRVYLKEYYTRLFTSVCKVDTSPALKSHVNLLMKVAEQRYDPKRREVGGDEDLVNGGGRGRRGRVQ